MTQATMSARGFRRQSRMARAVPTAASTVPARAAANEIDIAAYGARRAAMMETRSTTSPTGPDPRPVPRDTGRFVDSPHEAAAGPASWRRQTPRAELAGAASAALATVVQLPPREDPTAGAFFDVDNTLIRGASIYYFARGLAARDMFGPRDLARIAWGQVVFRLRG